MVVAIYHVCLKLFDVSVCIESEGLECHTLRGNSHDEVPHVKDIVVYTADVTEL